MPRPWTYLLPLLGFLGACAHAHGNRQVVSPKKGYTVTRNLIYTPAEWPEKIPADLYRPATPKPAPAVLLIHGGGWTGEDGRWQMDSIAAQLAKRGYVVLNVTYRLAPKYRYPAALEDVREGVKWLRLHAAENGIDPTRIATFGYSAGGYLAALAAYTGGSDIQAVVSGGAPSDLTFYRGGYLVPQFLGGTQQQVPERFRQASPVHFISKRSPPTFVYHAANDTLVPPEHAWAAIQALEKHGVPHEVYWIKARNHIPAFLLPASAINRAIDFLDRYLEP